MRPCVVCFTGPASLAPSPMNGHRGRPAARSLHILVAKSCVLRRRDRKAADLLLRLLEEPGGGSDSTTSHRLADKAFLSNTSVFALLFVGVHFNNGVYGS